MKIRLLFLFLLFPTMLIAKNVYYVSSSGGDDKNLGTSPEQAWKSLAKVNSFIPLPGDQILFKRGDSWDGPLIIPAEGKSDGHIVYGAYGTGEKPIVYGSKVIKDWTLSSGNIYRAYYDKDIVELFLNGKKMKAARFPNSGYANIDAVPTSLLSITCNALDGSIDYSGAGFATRTNGYAFETKTVASSSGTTLTLTKATTFSLSVNEGFILVNKLKLLDSPGEWFYDPAKDSVYFWTPNSDSPEKSEVRGSVQTYGIQAEKKFVEINNFNVKQSAHSGIRLTGSDCILDSNIIEDSNIQGIQIMFGVRNTISNNVIRGCNQYGLNSYTSATGVSKTVITDNEISDVMVFDDLGISLVGSWYSGSGMYIESPENTIQYNKIHNVGYNGIQFFGKNTIQYNFIKDACKVKDDGGGTYTSSSTGVYPNTTSKGSIIQYNIIDGVRGTLEGWAGYVITYGEGIYLDELSGYVTVNNNTVTNCSSNGIFLHNSWHDTITNNTVFNCKNLLCTSISQGKSVYKYNTCYALKKDPQNSSDGLNVYEYNANETWDYNNYINHYNKDAFKKQNTTYDFNGWKAETGQEANSTFDMSPLAAGETEKLFYNETKQTKVFGLENIIYRDLDGNQVSNSLSLEPFTSKILIKTNIPTKLESIENKDKGMFVYPNPTTGIVSLKSTRIQSDVCEISLYNLMGKQVLRKNIYSPSGKLEETINLSHLDEGIYIIHLKCGSMTSQNIIILKK